MPGDNLSIHLVERPTEEIVPGKTFESRVSPAPTPADVKDGEILVEVLYLSLDPSLRAQLNGASNTPLPITHDSQTDSHRLQTAAPTSPPSKSAPS